MQEIQPSAVVPAAGRSSRFGAQKLLANLDGHPLIRRTIDSLVAGGIADIVVVVGPESPAELIQLLEGLPVKTALNPDPGRGMLSSIQAGMHHVAGTPVVVLPADMPFVTGATVRLVTESCRATGRVTVPVVDGKRGHPVAIPRSICEVIVTADPGETLKDAVRSTGSPMELRVADTGILRDVDVPADLLPLDGEAR